MSRLIKVDVSDLFAVAADLNNAHDVINAGAARAVNSVAVDVRKETVTRITSQVNLKESYVDGKLEVSKDATPADTTAEISAPMEGVFLDRYGAVQKTQSNVWTAAMYKDKFGSLNSHRRPGPKAPKMPWTPRTGDKAMGRNIAAGQKAAGMSVAVIAGSAHKTISYAYIGKLKQGGVGMFRHVRGTNKIKAVKSLSVDQMAKIVWRKDADKISKTLSETVLAQVAADIEKELKK
jgi:hypothetical protein